MSQPACRDNDALLALHATGDLDPAESADLQVHLEGCVGCRAALQGYRETTRWLGGQRSAPEALPMVNELKRRLAAELPSRRQVPWLLAWLGRVREANRGPGEPVLAIVGTTLLALAALGTLATGGRDLTPPPGGASLRDGAATAVPVARERDDRLRIEMQTGDPNVRIIWFAAAAPGPR